MNAEDLRALVSGHENQKLELKENFQKPKVLADIMMQLANADGGLIVLGLTDERPPRFSGKIREVTQDNLDSIQRAARECLRPPLDAPRIEVVDIPDPRSKAVVIEIPKSIHRHQHIDGSLARRRGGEREVIYLDQEGSPGPTSTSPFEERPIAESSFDDVDLGRVSAFVSDVSNRRPDSKVADVEDIEVLRGLGAIIGEPGNERLTGLGALFFSAAPEQLVPQSRVMFVEFPGVTVAEPGQPLAYVDSAEVVGSLPEIISQVETLLHKKLAKAAALSGFKMERIPSLPQFALREAVVNAVCHRDYGLSGGNIQVRLFADRVEIQSPGGLPWPITLDNLLTESYARNPRIANALKDLGYVERYGIGIDNMVRSMQEAHLPLPEFKDSSGSFTVVLRLHGFMDTDAIAWLHSVHAEGLREEHQKALIAAWRNGQLVNADYRGLGFVDGPEATRQLHDLVRDGWLVQNSTRGAAFYTLGPKANGTTSLADVFPLADLHRLTEAQRRTLTVVMELGTPQASEVLERVGGRDRRTVQRMLAFLVEKRFLVRHAKSLSDPGAYYEVNHEYGVEGPGQQSLFEW